MDWVDLVFCIVLTMAVVTTGTAAWHVLRKD